MSLGRPKAPKMHKERPTYRPAAATAWAHRSCRHPEHRLVTNDARCLQRIHLLGGRKRRESIKGENPSFGGAQKERRGTKGVLLTCNSSPCSPQSATRLFFAWAGKHSAAGVRREARKPLTSSALYLECRGGTVAWLAGAQTKRSSRVTPRTGLNIEHLPGRTGASGRRTHLDI